MIIPRYSRPMPVPRNLQARRTSCPGGALRRLAFLVLSVLTLSLGLAAPDAAAEQAGYPRASISDATETEGRLLKFKVRFDRPAAGKGRFSYEARPGTATPGDYNADLCSHWKEFDVGAREITIFCRTSRDDKVEGDETFEMVLSGPQGLVLVDAVAVGTIRDSAPVKPEVYVLPGQSSVTEGGNVSFRLSSDFTAAPVIADVTVSQSGRFVPSARIGRTKVTIPADGPGLLVVPTTNDRSNERDGSVTLTIDASPNYTISKNEGSRTVKVLDNDLPTVGISAGPAIKEGNTATFTLTASPPPTAGLQVEVEVSESGSFAASGQTGKRTVTVGTGGRGRLSVSTVSDDLDEPDGSITVSIVRVTGYDVDVRSASVDVTDGGAPTPGIRISAGPAIGEGNTATFTLTASPAPTAGLQVEVEVSESGSFAASGQTGKRTVTVGTGGRGRLSVSTVSDDLDEADGEIAATLLDGSGYTLDTPVSARVPVHDGGAPTPRVTISPGERVIGEGATAFFRLTASPPPETPLAVTVDVVDSGSFLAPGYGGRGTVTVETDGRGTLRLLIQSDEVEEPDGFITASIVRQGERYAPGSRASARIEVRDDDAAGGDAAPRPRIGILSGPGIQEGAPAVFGLTASPPPETAIEVTVSVSETGSFAAGGQTGARTVTIGPGGTGFLTVTTQRDDVDEADGAIETTIAAGRDYDIVAPGSARIDVTDGGAPTPRIGIAPGPAVVEGAPAMFTLTASPPPETAIEVMVSVGETGRFAAGGQTGTRTVTIGADGTARFSVITEADEIGETGGSIAATVEPGALYAVGFPVAARVSVIDGDASRPMVSIDPGAPLVEGDTAIFTLSAIPPPEAEFAVEVEVSERGRFSATGQTGARTVTVGADGAGVLTVETEDDGDDEHAGSITAAIRSGADYSLGFPGSATVTVNDNDAAAGDVAVSVSDAQVIEGDPGSRAHLRFGVTLDRPSDQPVLVIYDLHGTAGTADTASATAGTDYWHTGRFVRIPPGETEARVMVRVIDDDEYEPRPETLRLTIERVYGGEIADGSAIGTILPDPRDTGPGTPVITISSGRATTEGKQAVFTLRASPAPVGDLPVRLTVLDAAGADSDSDFLDTAVEGARTVIVPGLGREARENEEVLAEVALDTVDDEVDEESGSVEVRIRHSGSNPDDAGHYVIGSPWRETVIVHDNDGQQEWRPEISVNDASGAEAGGRLRFEVTVNPPAPGAVSVDFRTAPLSATAGEDYVHRSGTLTIDAGESSGHVDIALLDDAHDDPGETLKLVLSRARGAAIADGEGIGTIMDSGPMLSVDDATAHEGQSMTFAVRLSKPLDRWVAVRLATRETRPVSARAQEDFIPRSSTVWFGPGETVRKLEVALLDDSHDDGGETFEVSVLWAVGAGIADGVAVGTIVNDDPLPGAWLARFGRAVAEQALDGIAARMTADRTPGLQGTLAGQALSFDPAANDNADHAAAGSPVFGGTGALALAEVARGFTDHSGRFGADGIGHDAVGFGNGSVSGAGGAGFTQSQSMTTRDALLGSSFSLTGQTDGSGGSMALWGRASQGSFDGREGTFSLDGEVTTGMLGADYARGKWLVGLALAQSAGEGEGDYRDTDVNPRPDGQTCPDGVDSGLCSGAVRAGDGDVEASLTAAIPYASLRASERLRLWGAAGYGTGEVTLKTAQGGSYKSDTTWSMAAAGLRGDLLAPPAPGPGSGAGSGASGPALAVTSDALWTRTSSEKTRGLAASDSDATRLRLGLEGSYRFAMEGGGSLVPKLEVGARHDGGDAETGFGVEVGGGIAWSDPALGLSLNVSGRTLLAHENDDLKDRGYAASLAFDPDPATQRGVSLNLRQEFGGQASGGLDALFQPATLEDRTGSEAASRWTAEAAYGFPAFGGRWTGSPHVGLGLSTATRDYSLGWRLTPEANAPDFSFGLRAARRESDTAQAEHTVGFEATARW